MSWLGNNVEQWHVLLGLGAFLGLLAFIWWYYGPDC